MEMVNRFALPKSMIVNMSVSSFKIILTSESRRIRKRIKKIVKNIK